jgi:hypothetical protein
MRLPRVRLRTLLIAVAVAALISYSIRIDGGGSVFFFLYFGALFSDMWWSPRPRPANWIIVEPDPPPPE